MALRQKYAWSDLIIAEWFELLKQLDYYQLMNYYQLSTLD